MTAPRPTSALSRHALTEGMHVISRKRLKEAVARHGDLEAWLDTWFRVAKRATWKNLEGVRKTFSSADSIGKWTVFNAKGNRYRLMTEINYASGRIYIRHVLTHAEYDRGSWKS